MNVALIVVTFAVWIFYSCRAPQRGRLPRLLLPMQRRNACHALTVVDQLFTAMFMHGSWDHILGNMLFLAIFGKNVEDAFGHLRYLAFYVAGGFAATMTQTAVTLLFGTEAEARVPNLGASGAIAAVLGAFIVLYPSARIRTLVGIFFVQIPTWVYLGGWFLYQLVEGNFGLASASANGDGVAFFAHVGGFVFGALVTAKLLNARRIVPESAMPHTPADERLKPLAPGRSA